MMPRPTLEQIAESAAYFVAIHDGLTDSPRGIVGGSADLTDALAVLRDEVTAAGLLLEYRLATAQRECRRSEPSGKKPIGFEVSTEGEGRPGGGVRLR